MHYPESHGSNALARAVKHQMIEHQTPSILYYEPLCISVDAFKQTEINVSEAFTHGQYSVSEATIGLYPHQLRRESRNGSYAAKQSDLLSTTGYAQQVIKIVGLREHPVCLHFMKMLRFELTVDRLTGSVPFGLQCSLEEAENRNSIMFVPYWIQSNELYNSRKETTAN